MDLRVRSHKYTIYEGVKSKSVEKSKNSNQRSGVPLHNSALHWINNKKKDFKLVFCITSFLVAQLSSEISSLFCTFIDKCLFLKKKMTHCRSSDKHRLTSYLRDVQNRTKATKCCLNSSSLWALEYLARSYSIKQNEKSLTFITDKREMKEDKWNKWTETNDQTNTTGSSCNRG